jgi:hypothetical protein
MQRPPVRIGFGILAILIALCLVPFKRMTTPHWYIGVTNADGSPASNILVREEANDYSCGSTEQEEDATSNIRGQVEFAPKYIRTTMALCIFETVRSASAGVHTSFGRYTYVFALGGVEGDVIDEHGNIYHWTGSPSILHSQLILRH